MITLKICQIKTEWDIHLLLFIKPYKHCLVKNEWDINVVIFEIKYLELWFLSKNDFIFMKLEQLKLLENKTVFKLENDNILQIICQIKIEGHLCLYRFAWNKEQIFSKTIISKLIFIHKGCILNWENYN